MCIFASKMSNNYFQFKQFCIKQDRCAMKVGTDGTLLGAWAWCGDGVHRILDIGTGTGLIALMMAQRCPQAYITAIDIDSDAVSQARENVLASPFASRIEIVHSDLQHYHHTERYDVIVSNPPYFVDSLVSPDGARTMARHTDMLTFAALMQGAYRLLRDGGMFSVVIPFDHRARLEAEAALAGFIMAECCAVKTTERKPPRRFLLTFSKNGSQHYHRDEIVIGSERYNQLVSAFYL